MLIVPKKDGKLRIFVDYIKLTTMTINDTYLLLLMYESIDTLGVEHFFTALNAHSGYWQMKVRKKD